MTGSGGEVVELVQTNCVRPVDEHPCTEFHSNTSRSLAVSPAIPAPLSLLHARVNLKSQLRETSLDALTCIIPFTRAFHKLFYQLIKAVNGVNGRPAYTLSSITSVSTKPSEYAKPIDMPFGLWTPVGQRKHVFDMGVHWRSLANTVSASRR